MRLEINRRREIFIYNDPKGAVKVDVLIRDETIWLPQQKMAEVFGVDRTSISRHLKNIFDSGELVEEVVCAEIAHTTQHGAIEGLTQQTKVKYYNLDAIISVGYRINSKLATQFRIWATMGLTTWRNAPNGMIRRQDVVIAKNYLSEKELNGLNRIVTAYLDYAEMQAENYVVLTMKDWIDKLNAFLQFNEKEILENAGKVSATIAQEFALNEYEKYNQTVLQNYESDFDKLLRIGKNQ